MITPSALNILIIGASTLVFFFLWRMAAFWLVDRNPDSKIGQAMATIL